MTQVIKNGVVRNHNAVFVLRLFAFLADVRTSMTPPAMSATAAAPRTAAVRSAISAAVPAASAVAIMPTAAVPVVTAVVAASATPAAPDADRAIHRRIRRAVRVAIVGVVGLRVAVVIGGRNRASAESCRRSQQCRRCKEPAHDRLPVLT